LFCLLVSNISRCLTAACTGFVQVVVHSNVCSVLSAQDWCWYSSMLSLTGCARRSQSFAALSHLSNWVHPTQGPLSCPCHVVLHSCNLPQHSRNQQAPPENYYNRSLQEAPPVTQTPRPPSPSPMSQPALTESTVSLLLGKKQANPPTGVTQTDNGTLWDKRWGQGCCAALTLQPTGQALSMH
jgi:hypothetical protein